MKKFPWRAIMIGSTFFVLLVGARCVATVFMERYWGRLNWLPVVLRDPWLYVGLAAVVLVYVSSIATLIQNRKKKS